MSVTLSRGIRRKGVKKEKKEKGEEGDRVRSLGIDNWFCLKKGGFGVLRSGEARLGPCSGRQSVTLNMLPDSYDQND